MKKIIVCLFLLLFLAFASALIVDMNGVGITSGGDANSASYNTVISIGEPVVGNASSTNYNTYLGFYLNSAVSLTKDNYAGQRIYDVGYVGPHDVNLQFSCTDDIGCVFFSYSINDTNYFNSWGAADQNLGVVLDTMAKQRVSYYSTNKMDNNEGAHTICVGVGFADPIVTITGPGSSAQGRSVEFTFTGADNNDFCPITKFWVKVDSNSWQDNGDANSYVFSIGAEQLPTTHTFYVKSMSAADRNSVVQSKTLAFVSGTGGDVDVSIGQGPGETGNQQQNPTGDKNQGTETQVTVTEKRLLSFVRSDQLSSEPSFAVIEQTGELGSLSNKRFATSLELEITEHIESFAVTNSDTNKTSYKSRVAITVRNKTKKTFNNIELIQSIDKNVLDSAKRITSDYNFQVIKEDPVISFFIKELGPLDSKKIVYDFNSGKETWYLTESRIEGIKPVVALIELQPGDACYGIKCNDYNPCTKDYCAEGCSFIPLRDGTLCGGIGTCKKGACSIPVGPAQWWMPIFLNMTSYDYILLALFVLVFIAGAYMQVTVRHWRKSHK